MNKIRKITFKDHPVLKNLSLDFCDETGNPVDTVILAGENGTGKSTIIDVLYNNTSMENVSTALIEFETDQIIKIAYRKDRYSYSAQVINTKNEIIDFQAQPFPSIFSDVDINFHSGTLNSVTSLSLDSFKESRKSSTNLPQEINQLLIDIQALDDADLSKAYRQATENGSDTNNIQYQNRMSRFTNAFNLMFDNLKYDRIENIDGHKEIIFKKNGVDIPIEKLSSGEKQIVYRGCFLLKDANALNGAFVFIDEPEISLHPSWQEKIMDYYKGIFTDENGNQTSQIFVVTHSPFIIHNKNRRNDKVIVIGRDNAGNIFVKDKPEYYKCNSLELVEDAFSIHDFSTEQPTVYLEGRTDEKYFKKALEVFGYNNIPFQFKWIGYMKDNQEFNTGCTALDKAVDFLTARNLPVKNVCLYDCDTKKTEKELNNVCTKVIPYQDNKTMKRGIENALILDNIDLNPFYLTKENVSDYGEKKQNQEFQKMECCNHICSLDAGELRHIFANLKSVIDSLISFFNGENS